MPIWSNFGDSINKIKNKFKGRVFTCKKCGKVSKFEKLTQTVDPGGYSFLCPDCGWFVLVPEDYMKDVYPYEQ